MKYEAFSCLDVIEHYGKKGMKWGVRSSQKSKKNPYGRVYDEYGNPLEKETKLYNKYRSKGLSKEKSLKRMRRNKVLKTAAGTAGYYALTMAMLNNSHAKHPIKKASKSYIDLKYKNGIWQGDKYDGIAHRERIFTTSSIDGHWKINPKTY